MSAIDTFLFVGCSLIAITSIILFGRWQERYSIRSRTVHKRYQTNYQRLQARLATGSGAIQKGGN